MARLGFPITPILLLVTAVAVTGTGAAAADATAPVSAGATSDVAATDPGATASASATATAPSGDPELLARITANAKTLTTVAGTFTQKTSSSGDGDAPKILTGVFTLEIPDKYSVVESRPGDPVWRLRQWSDGQGHWQSEQQFAGMDPDVSVHDGDADLERVLACLRGDFAVLAADYRVTAEAAGDGATVLLMPLAPGGHDSPVRIVLDHDFHAKSVDIDQPGGQHIQLSVTSATYGLPTPAGSFTPPKL